MKQVLLQQGGITVADVPAPQVEPGAVLGREALLEDVWGTDFPGETRTVDVHVSELRKKLGPDGPTIKSGRGGGYRLIADA